MRVRKTISLTVYSKTDTNGFRIDKYRIHTHKDCTVIKIISAIPFSNRYRLVPFENLKTFILLLLIGLQDLSRLFCVPLAFSKFYCLLQHQNWPRVFQTVLTVIHLKKVRILFRKSGSIKIILNWSDQVRDSYLTQRPAR